MFYAVGQVGIGCVLSVLLVRPGAWHHNSFKEWVCHVFRVARVTVPAMPYVIPIIPIGGHVAEYLRVLEDRYSNLIDEQRMLLIMEVEVVPRYHSD